jgi:hypothetical protein
MSDRLILKSAHGSASILPERGRVLQIETGGHEAFWNPPEMTAAWNLGGERLWLGPEASWFWKMTDKVDFDYYQVPPGPLVRSLPNGHAGRVSLPQLN